MERGAHPPSRTPDSRWPASFKEAGLLLLLAAVATGISWFLRSDGLPVTADPVRYELELAAPLAGVEEAWPFSRRVTASSSTRGPAPGALSRPFRAPSSSARTVSTTIFSVISTS